MTEPREVDDPMAGCDPVVTESILLDVPKSRVLELLEDAEKYPKWVIGTRRVTGIDPSWPEAGSTFDHEFGIWPLLGHDQTRMVRLDEAAGVVTLEARGRPAGRAMVRIEVADRSEGGCVVTLAEGPFSGPARLVPSMIVAPLLRLRNQRSLRRLRRLARA